MPVASSSSLPDSRKLRRRLKKVQMRGGARRPQVRRSSDSALASWLRPSARTATYVEPAAEGANEADGSLSAASAHVAGVAQRIAAGLGPDGETVRLLAHGDLGHLSRRGVEDVNDIVVAPREP